MKYKIENFNNLQHKDQVISLWNNAFGYEADHNAPKLIIEKKLEIDDGLFFVIILTCHEFANINKECLK